MRLILFALAAAAILGLSVVAQETKTGPKSDSKAKDEKKEKSSLKETPPEISEVAGKSLEQWIREISSKDPSKREAAIRTVLLFGPERAYQAVPVLLQELKKHTVNAPIDLSVRTTGANALATILGAVKDPDPKYQRDAVVILRGFLKDHQVAVRHRALQALPKIGPESRAALDEVVKLVNDPDTWETRQAAVQTLTVLAADPKAGPPTKVLTAVTRSATGDPSFQVRYAAIQALAIFGASSDATARVGIVRTLDTLAHKDPDPGNQLWAHMAIMTAQQKITDEQLGAVAKMLKHPDVMIRLQATQALGMAGPLGKSAVPPLISALGDADPQVVGGSIVALARIESVSAVPPLRQLVNDPKQDDVIKKAAADAIDHIQNGKKKVEMKK
jgi:HEAT repeat protein